MSEQPPSLPPPDPPPAPPPGPPPGSTPRPFQPMPYQPQPGYGAVAGAVTNQKAIISLVVSIVGLLCCGIVMGPIAIYLGNAAQKEIAASGGAQSGSGLAKAGLIIGIIEVVLFVLFMLLFVGGMMTSLRHASGQ